ncbi:MAG: hypothetical protein V1750_06245, partial [Acidobacteriota bacterium]
ALRRAERALQLASAGSSAARQAELLVAEALVELGRYPEAPRYLEDGWERGASRWDWICRRLVSLSGLAGGAPIADELVSLRGSTRVSRIAAYWRAEAAARNGDRSGLEQLADSGFPDLPALWATARLGRRGVNVALSGGATSLPAPPPWSRDLLAAGRVADTLVAWRAELERRDDARREWLALEALAELPPLDAIPLLVRGEPRLMRGPWSGLDR